MHVGCPPLPTSPPDCLPLPTCPADSPPNSRRSPRIPKAHNAPEAIPKVKMSTKPSLNHNKSLGMSPELSVFPRIPPEAKSPPGCLPTQNVRPGPGQGRGQWCNKGRGGSQAAKGGGPNEGDFHRHIYIEILNLFVFCVYLRALFWSAKSPLLFFFSCFL